jgi:hypothetical protein
MTGKKSSSSNRNHRDAGSGQYVTPGYAKSHPKTTVSEPRGNGGKKK